MRDLSNYDWKEGVKREKYLLDHFMIHAIKTHTLLRLELLRKLSRRFPGDFMEALDEEGLGTKRQLFGDFSDRQPGELKKHLGSLDIGVADIQQQRRPGLLFKLVGQIIFGKPSQGSQIRNPNLLVKTQLDIITALLDGRRVVGVGVKMMDPIDKVVVAE